MTDSAESSLGSQLLIREEVLREAMRQVLADAGTVGFATRLDDLEMDSLLLAELIIQLEEGLGTLLELGSADRLDTLGDLCRALRSVGP